jgi:mRNA interferase MazF
MTFPSELWLVDFGDPFPSEPAHTRPALVVGPPATFGETFPLVLVAPLTSRGRGLNLHVEVEGTPESGLATTRYIQTEGLRSVSKARLIRRLGRISHAEMHQVRIVLARLLAFDARST